MTDSTAHRAFCEVLEDGELDRQEKIGEGPSGVLLRSSQDKQIDTTGGGEGGSSTEGLEALRRGIVGRLAPFTTPFGTRPIVYADWTASGRAHDEVEHYINKEVLPFYGNTHTVRSHSISHTQHTAPLQRSRLLAHLHFIDEIMHLL
jgi:hypothetical protein